MEVRKRDKTLERFNFSKIENAVSKAFTETGIEMPDDVLLCLREKYDESGDDVVGVESIQDSVEDCLMAYSPKVAKAYIIYRYEHKVMRDNKDKLFREIGRKLKAEDVQNQNANVDEYSFGGRLGEATRVVTKDYALKNCMTRKSRNNHLNNEIYIHDLDSYAIGMHNCLSIPFDDLLSNGFVVKNTDVRPANSVDTAMQLVAVIFQLQSLQQFGGVSATHLDWTMVPYVRKSFVKHYRDGLNWIYDVGLPDYDGKVTETPITSWESKNYHKAYEYAMQMTEKEVKQAVEGMYHNLNTLQSRSGNQLPFTSINYGTCTLPEGRMVTRALLEGSLEGVGKFHRTPIFPCGIFQMMSGVNRQPGDPNYDLYKLALKSTAQRLYPNYANCDWSGNAGYDKNDPRTYFSTMGKQMIQPISNCVNTAKWCLVA